MLEVADAADLHLVGGVGGVKRQGFVPLTVDDAHIVGLLAEK